MCSSVKKTLTLPIIVACSLNTKEYRQSPGKINHTYCSISGIPWRFPSAWCSLVTVPCGFSLLTVFIAAVTRHTDVHLLSFWMPNSHSTTCSSCLQCWPYSFICGRGIILFIEVWNWSALPDHRFDPPSLNVLARVRKSRQPYDNTCSVDNCFQKGWCPAHPTHNHNMSCDMFSVKLPVFVQFLTISFSSSDIVDPSLLSTTHIHHPLTFFHPSII